MAARIFAQSRTTGIFCGKALAVPSFQTAFRRKNLSDAVKKSVKGFGILSGANGPNGEKARTIRTDSKEIGEPAKPVEMQEYAGYPCRIPSGDAGPVLSVGACKT